MYLLAEAKRDFDCVREHRFVPVKALQRLHTVGSLALSLITIPNYRRYHFLARRMFVTSFQRLVTRTLEVQYRVVDCHRLFTWNIITICTRASGIWLPVFVYDGINVHVIKTNAFFARRFFLFLYVLGISPSFFFFKDFFVLILNSTRNE